MKKALVLLSMSILLVSCMEKQQEEVVLDKEDQKIIEEVLDINNEAETENNKNTEEAVEAVKVVEVVEAIEETDNKIVKEETVVEVKVEPTIEEEVEANNLLKDLLGTESDIDTALDDVTK